MTKQVDIDLYNDKGGKVDVSGMKVDIEIIIERMKVKEPEAVSFANTDTVTVNVDHRLQSLQQRKKLPLIYHYFNTSRPYASMSIQIKLGNVVGGDSNLEPDSEDNRLVVLGRHEKLPTLKDCDFVQALRFVNETDGKFESFILNFITISNETFFITRRIYRLVYKQPYDCQSNRSMVFRSDSSENSFNP